MADIQKKIDVKATLNRWQKFTIQDWKNNLRKMRIGKTGALQRSFITHLALRSAGDISKLQFQFLYYGRFVDMGVGKGVKIGDVKDRQTRRRPKKWYSKALAYNVDKLGEILARQYGSQFAKMVAQSIETIKA